MAKPADNWADEIADRLADQLLAMVEGVPEAKMPMGAVKLSQAEQMQQFVAIRNDPQAWLRVAQERGATLEQMVNYDRMMERRFRAQETRDATADESGDTMVGELPDRMAEGPGG